MTAILWLHIASGIVALVTGTLAILFRKGGTVHVRAGTGFFAAMLALGITAAILEPYRTPEPGSPVGGLMVWYFVLTSWFAARRRDGRTGWFEVVACVAALGLGTLIALSGITGSATTPAGAGPLFAVAGFCLFAGLLDLKVVLSRTMTPVQRVSRHLWRMCFAFFIATGSFFLGQQDMMPAGFQRSPWLFVPAFAPFAAMAFWLVRVRIGRRFRPVTS